ncbi:MAG: hypothetical protein ACK5LT_00040 [Lachnospirales bacterium]
MADERRKEWDKKTNAQRNEKKALVVFNMKKEADIILYEKFLKIKEEYECSDSQTIKNLIIER